MEIQFIKEYIYIYIYIYMKIDLLICCLSTFDAFTDDNDSLIHFNNVCNHASTTQYTHVT